MANNKTSKIKVLYLLRILQEETDAEHGLTMSEIIKRLNDLGVSAERKSIYKDIQLLRTFGIEVKTYQRNPVEYAIASRELDSGELMLIADAVYSCRAISERQAGILVEKVKTLATNLDKPKLDRDIRVVGRIKRFNESVLKKVDAIYEAKNMNCKVSFVYTRKGPDGKRHAEHFGVPRVVTPVAVTYDAGFYYLSAFDDEREKMLEYRLDRMTSFAVLKDEPAVSNEATESYKAMSESVAVFGRFVGNEQEAVLAAAPDKYEIIADRFADAVVASEACEDGSSRATVKVCVSEQFFGWVAGMGGAVTIAGPQSLVDEYRAFLRGLLEE